MKQRLIATVLISVVWVIIDMIVHGNFLMAEYTATASLWRPMAEMKMPLSNIATIAIAFTFVVTFCQLISNKTLEKGIKLGALVGTIVGISAAVSYAYMPITSTIAWGWLISEIIKFTAAGFITGKLVTTEMKG